MNRKGAGRPRGTFTYKSPYTGNFVPVHVYKQEIRAYRREAECAKTNNGVVSGFTSEKIDNLVKIRDMIEEMIKAELQKIVILNKVRTI